ncbi:MAG: methionyl-tRNA formyltransferase [Chitinophagales bacterium]|nr:methionyl-tRNA formyltransferase [Chitinophagales bacterium]
MDKEQCRVVFMGTPEFAVESLKAIHEAGYNVVGVITAVDKPAGRGRSIQQSAVKKYAVEHELEVLQPKNLKNKDFIADLSALEADLFAVVAFRMLPEVVWSLPPKGTINLHASLLPDYRGAAPINWVLINGEEESGLTTFFIEKEIDTGKIILQNKLKIGENETAGELHDRMKVAGAELLLETVDSIFSGSYTQYDQDPEKYKNKAPKLFKENCRIDWDKDATTVHNFIRGLSPFPGAWTKLGDKILKIYRSKVDEETESGIAGEITVTEDSKLNIACGEQWIEVLELQMEGKKRMASSEFLKGNKVGSVMLS